ncbi:SGNH_hydrolase domain containing protein [Methylophilaceae bacterium]
MPTSWIKSERLKDALFILAVSLALLLVVDYFLGYKILHNAPISTRNNAERGLGIRHPTYHHSLAANYNGLTSFDQQTEYRFCTNDGGFKSDCNNIVNGKDYDIAFLGDSFTEGIGLPYEKTFVGLIAAKLSEKKIANLAVASYAPSVYYIKLLELINNGYHFKEVVVYIDISDIQDEANYSIVNGKVIDTIENTSKHYPLPLINFGLKGFKSRFLAATNSGPHATHLDLSDGVYSSEYRRSAWTVNKSDEGYGRIGLQASIDKSVALLEKIHALCIKNNIKLSVGVYPWPGQILYDTEESKQVKIWRNFCSGKCAHFYNSFPTLFKIVESTSKEEVIANYYFKGDMHFNEAGNQLIATDFLKTYQADSN